MSSPDSRPRNAWRLERIAPERMPELMDAPDCDRSELAAALEVLGRSGRLGGDRLLRRQVDALLRDRAPGPLRLLDVGVGGGHGALTLRSHLRRLGWSPTFLLADLHAGTLGLCRETVLGRCSADGVRFLRLDGTRLPLRPDSVDIAYSSLTLHHLEEPEADAFLRELERVSRIGWALVDLRRSRLVQATVGLLASTAWRRAAYSRADGPVSVRRSFTPEEIRALLSRAGVRSGAVEGRLIRWAARGTT